MFWNIKNKLSVPKSIRAAAKERRRDRREILEDRLLGLSINLADASFLAQFLPTDFRDENRPLFADLLALRRPADQFRAELLSFSADVDMKEQQLDPQPELAKTASEFQKLLTRQRMLELGSQLALAEQAQNKAAVEQLSQEYAELAKKISN